MEQANFNGERTKLMFQGFLLFFIAQAIGIGVYLIDLTYLVSFINILSPIPLLFGAYILSYGIGIRLSIMSGISILIVLIVVTLLSLKLEESIMQIAFNTQFGFLADGEPFHKVSGFEQHGLFMKGFGISVVLIFGFTKSLTEKFR